MFKDMIFLNDDTVSFILKDGQNVTIRFSIVYVDGAKLYKRVITTESGSFENVSDFDVFEEGLTVQDFIQWTADNFCEITEQL